MYIFNTYNQFDDRYKVHAEYNHNACPYFAFITGKNFMDNGQITKVQYEKNLDDSVVLSMKSGLPKYVTMDEITQITNTISASDVNVTSPELINQNIVGYNHIFGNGNTDYCVIFLKNNNYIVVLAKKINADYTYSIRDCHKKTQYDYYTLEDLTNHLNNIYQFNKLTVVGGLLIEEYANIEFVIITKQFDITMHETVSLEEAQPIDNNTDNGLSEFERMLLLSLQIEEYQS